MKYQNDKGISLMFTGNDSTSVLVREVVEEAIRILKSHNMFDKHSMGWAIDRGISFLEENFDVGNENNDEWRIKQFNRNRAPEDQVSTIEEMESKIDEIFNS